MRLRYTADGGFKFLPSASGQGYQREGSQSQYEIDQVRFGAAVLHPSRSAGQTTHRSAGLKRTALGHGSNGWVAT